VIQRKVSRSRETVVRGLVILSAGTRECGNWRVQEHERNNASADNTSAEVA